LRFERERRRSHEPVIPKAKVLIKAVMVFAVGHRLSSTTFAVAKWQIRI
jgi:hypothetical protein